MADKAPLFTKHELKEKLENGVITVTFTKVSDNTERVMKATLLAEYLPEQDSAKLLVESTNKEKDDVVAVWDAEAKGWRSFRTDKVISVE